MINGQVEPHLAMRAFKGVALTFCCLLVIFPFLAIFTTSFASAADVASAGGLVLWPREWSLNAYEAIFSGGVVTRAMGVSGFVTIVGTLLSLAVTTLLAYSLAQRVIGRRFMLMLVLLSMLFSPGLIPSYLMVRGVGLIDSVWALIIPTMLSGFNVVVIRAFFMNLPQELLDAARIDGAGEWKTFSRIVLPLSKAVLAVIGLFYAVGYWNAFFNAQLYINDATKYPLQLVLRSYVVNNTQVSTSDINVDALPPQASLQMAILVVSIVPIVVVYPFLQRYFTKGVLTGAVKG